MSSKAKKASKEQLQKNIKAVMGSGIKGSTLSEKKAAAKAAAKKKKK